MVDKDAPHVDIAEDQDIDRELDEEDPIIEDLDDEVSDDMITDREEGFVRGYQEEAESGHSED